MVLDESSLLRLLHSTEHTFAERKTVGDSKDWVKTVVAFANTLDPSQEGVLFIGVTDKGDIEANISNLDKLQKTFSEKMQGVYPSLYYTTKTLKEDLRECLAVIVPGSPSKPHFAGPLYLRDGSQSVVAKAEQYDLLLAARTSKANELQRWIAKEISIVEYRRQAGVGYVIHKSSTVAKIEGCNQFYVTASMGNRKISYALASVEIAYDHQFDRLQIERSITETMS
jgi:predicted HTH transcriptional regulator